MDFQSRNHHIYFVYGTNMHPEQIAKHCGSPALLGAACVADHRLDFFGHSPVWDGGEEAAVPHAGETVWGALYRMTFGEADKLDEWQGVKIDGTGRYFLFPVFAVDLQGVSHAALLYRKDICSEPSLPSSAQRDFMAAGAKAQGVPGAYVERLEGLAAKPARYPVPKAIGGRLSAFTCHGCG
jgi:gamma-glutamylcyclotransferase (GGCT)/AIG2-like uncharacterized protein YtfP